MSKIISFPALIPTQATAQKMACPPYDVINTQDARDYVKGNPVSLLHITRAEVDLPPEIDEHDDRVYARAKANFEHFIKEGWLTKEKDLMMIYRIESRGSSQTGLVCGTSVDEYDSGKIKQHEKTRKIKEDDRTRFAYTIRAHAEPVIIVFKALNKISDLMNAETQNEPIFNIVDNEGVRHIFWRVKDPSVFVKAFESIPALYIADGHHRSAAASRVRAKMKDENPAHTGKELYNFFPAVLFPHNEVKIYRYDWDGTPDTRPLADVTMEDVMKLSDEHGIMPPKSTWFAPKLSSGLFVYPF